MQIERDNAINAGFFKQICHETCGDRLTSGGFAVLTRIGALVGASSCITQDVPADALALERTEQRIVEGYAATRRAKLEEKED